MRRILHTVLIFLFMGTLLLSLPLSAQQYRVEYTYNAAGCRTSRKVIVLQNLRQQALPETVAEEPPTDIEPMEDRLGMQELRIYPNPTQGRLRVEVGNTLFDPATAEESPAELHLFDAAGHLLQHHRITGIDLELDLTAYPSGWYLLTLQNTHAKQEYKIIKE